MMSLWKRFFGKKEPSARRLESNRSTAIQSGVPVTASGDGANPSRPGTAAVPPQSQVSGLAGTPLTGPGSAPVAGNRRIRVFVSSTFRDMVEDRNQLMTHAWPALRRLCRERQVEFVEVDLRWGITEAQSTRRETLKLCLDEIRACRPFFICMLGERYGWVPGDDAFTEDLKEEQPWLAGLRGKSVTEMEILHGVLNNPEMVQRTFFYFRDPAYAKTRGSDYLSDTEADAEKHEALKALIRDVCRTRHIPLRENYADPGQLAAMVLADLSAAVEAQFPKESIPDPLSKAAQEHEAFAETRRRTYVGRAEYFEALDRHAVSGGGPLVLLGDSGSGKSALLANWLAHWRQGHPEDFVVQQYVGGTADSANHWWLMGRVIAEIKRWSEDPEAQPSTCDDIRRDFPLWLAKARARAAHKGVRLILVLDALNQLDDQDHARLLGWLPEHPFSGPLRLVVSTLPGKSGEDDPLSAIRKRGWQELHIEPLTVEERRRLIVDYLARFGKTLDEHRLVRLASAASADNPLYLKILLDDLRVTGTHERLHQRLTDYLAATDIPSLLQQVLDRYQRDYERDRPGLVADVLGLIFASRRGLSETELLQLLRPADQAQLPPAIWTLLRAALEDSLVDRGGILNFAHEFLRRAVGRTFAIDEKRSATLRLQLADYFEAQPITERSCDELPWLLKETASLDRLRSCLLHIDRFLLIKERDEQELRRYWIEELRERQTMGKAYLSSFESWSAESGPSEQRIAFAANELGLFLLDASLHAEAEPLMRRALETDERVFGEDEAPVGRDLNGLALLLKATNRLDEAERYMRRAIDVCEWSCGEGHLMAATSLNNLAGLLVDRGRPEEAKPLMRRALEIDELSLGKDHPVVANDLNNLAGLLHETGHIAEAEPLMRRALDILERGLGEHHPDVGRVSNNLAQLLQDRGRGREAESLMRRAIEIDELSFGEDHPSVARDINNLVGLLIDTGQIEEADQLMRRPLEIAERCFDEHHPVVARCINNLVQALLATSQLDEALRYMRRALEIAEHNLGKSHPDIAMHLDQMASVLSKTGQITEAEHVIRRAVEIAEYNLGEDHPDVATRLYRLAVLVSLHSPDRAEPLLCRVMEIHMKHSQATGNTRPQLNQSLQNYRFLLEQLGFSAEQIALKIGSTGRKYGIRTPGW
ncbi:MAG: tetratricopeptide repeat protein [Acidobacteriota bacterium]